MKSPLPEEDGPTFEPLTHFCMKHLAPFKRTWTLSQGSTWVKAMIGVFEVAHRRDDIVAAAGGDTRMLDRVLREFSPLCCLIGDEETARWTKLAMGPLDEYKAAIEEIRKENHGNAG